VRVANDAGKGLCDEITYDHKPVVLPSIFGFRPFAIRELNVAANSLQSFHFDCPLRLPTHAEIETARSLSKIQNVRGLNADDLLAVREEMFLGAPPEELDQGNRSLIGVIDDVNQ
jgi:hypothetical protein